MLNSSSRPSRTPAALANASPQHTAHQGASLTNPASHRNRHPPPFLASRWRTLTQPLRNAIVGTLAIGLLLCIVATVLAHRIAPMVRSRLTLVLSRQLQSPVAIGTVQTHFNGDFTVDVDGLSAQSILRGIPGDPSHPMLRIAHVSLRMGLLQALLGHTDIGHAAARGILVDLPPQSTTPPAANPPDSIHLGSLTLDDVHVTFNTADPTRAPLRFDIPHATLTGLDRPGPFSFDATVDNGAPIGLVETRGTMGPWNTADPRATPLQGTFSFANRSVGSVPGLRGNLSMQADYHGTLALLQTTGTTHDPAFGLDISAHTFDLHTTFNMQIDAVQGIVHLASIDAHFAQTHFLVDGTVTRGLSPAGYRLDLALTVPQARIEDALALGVKTQPSLLRGALTMQGHLLMPAGPTSVSRKLVLRNGRFHLAATQFGNPAVQRDVDAMDERARGRPDDASASASATSAAAEGDVSLRNATLRLTTVRVACPATQLALAGTYALANGTFAMSGTLHTAAKASQMQSGVKGLLTRPFNGMFSHGRPGATLPVYIAGSGNTPTFHIGIPGGKQMKVPGLKH